MKMIVLALAILSLEMLTNAAHGQMQASPSRSDVSGGRFNGRVNDPANRDIQQLLQQRAAQQKTAKPKTDTNEAQERIPDKSSSGSKSAGDSVPTLDSNIHQLETARAEAELACERERAAGRAASDCSTKKKR